MADRSKIFIAYCFPEKRWLDRVQAELDLTVGSGRCTVWDERKLKAGATLTEQGEKAESIYLLLDGVIQVLVDGEEVANLGPGALIGERAVLEGGIRTATLIAVSPCKVAEARKVELDLDKLAEVSVGHRREGATSP